MEALTEAAARLAAFCVPPPENRVLWSRYNVAQLMVPSLLLLPASYVRLRHPGTPWLLRLLYVCVATPCALHIVFGHFSGTEWTASDGVALSLLHLDLVQGVAGAVWVLELLEMLFLGRESDFEIRDAFIMMDTESKKERSGAAGHNVASGNGHATTTGDTDADAPWSAHAWASCLQGHVSLARPRYFPGTTMPLEMDIWSSVRGHGYGRGPPQSKAGYTALLEAKKLEAAPRHEASRLKRKVFKRTAAICLLNFVVMDVCQSVIQDERLFPAVSRHGPAQLSEARQGVAGSFGPWIVTLFFGILVVSAIQCVSTIQYALTLPFTPPARIPIVQARFEPFLMGNVLMGTSVRDLWGKHWHTLFRRILVVCAYEPCRHLCLRLGLPQPLRRALCVLAVFTLSGLAHEGCLEGVLPYFVAWDARGLTLPSSSPPAWPASLGWRKHQPVRTAERGFGARNFAMTRFFVAQGLAIILEDIWQAVLEPWLARMLLRPASSTIENKQGTEKQKPRLVTNERLRAYLGRTWMLLFIIYTGSNMVDIVARHGGFQGAGAVRLSGRMFHALERRFS